MASRMHRSAANADDVGIRISVVGEREPKAPNGQLIGRRDRLDEADEEIAKADDESPCRVSALAQEAAGRTRSIWTVAGFTDMKGKGDRRMAVTDRCQGWARQLTRVWQMHEASFADNSLVIFSVERGHFFCRPDAAPVWDRPDRKQASESRRRPVQSLEVRESVSP